MKNQIRSARLVTGVLTICTLAISINASAKNPKEITFEIENNKLVIKSNKIENDCKYSGNNKGCIRVKKNEKTEIYFHLKGPLKCTKESGTSWKLNAVYLGGYNSAVKPRSSKFGFEYTSDARFDKVDADFDIADRKSGKVTAQVSDRKITITDNNKYKYNVWYKVEAKCEREDGGEPWISTFDPRVKNEGTD